MGIAQDGVAIKLDRAAEHLEAIDSGFRQFIEVDLENRTSQVADIDPDERGWQFIKWGKVPTPDPRLGAVLGGFVHNVRSALDQTIWQLVKANGCTPERTTQWPVSETEGQWRNDITHRDVAKRGPAPTAGLSNDAFELVRQFQPFRAGKKLRSKDPLLFPASALERRQAPHPACRCVLPRRTGGRHENHSRRLFGAYLRPGTEAANACQRGRNTGALQAAKGPLAPT
jgi:hypothetical protein